MSCGSISNITGNPTKVMEVERELTGRETEPWEIIYFRLHQSQLPLVDGAIETAGLMPGPENSWLLCITSEQSDCRC